MWSKWGKKKRRIFCAWKGEKKKDVHTSKLNLQPKHYIQFSFALRWLLWRLALYTVQRVNLSWGIHSKATKTFRGEIFFYSLFQGLMWQNRIINILLNSIPRKRLSLGSPQVCPYGFLLSSWVVKNKQTNKLLTQCMSEIVLCSLSTKKYTETQIHEKKKRKVLLIQLFKSTLKVFNL